MSIDILFELQQETRRLFIAGSAMAANDLRLNRLLPGLKKLGETAPVFNRLAAATEELLGASREDSAAKLLELSTLLVAILYTQGKTDAAGEPQPVQGAGIALATDIPYRKLHPFIEALTTKGQGRLEQIRVSYEDGSFLDLRALPAVCAALEDSYAEIPDFVQEKLIPAFGASAVPVLQSQLNLQGGKGDGRRLQLLHRQLGATMLELVAEGASTGSTEVKLAAISILGAYADQEPLLLALSRDKRKDVRAAAYAALASIGTAPALDRLYEAAVSKDGEIAVEPIRQSGSPQLLERLIRQGEQALAQYSNGEAKLRTEASGQLLVVLHALEGAGKKMASEAFPFVQRLLTTGAYLVPETENAQEAAAELLLEMDLPEADQLAIELGNGGNGPFIRYGFRAAFRRLTPTAVYDRYAGQFNSAKSKTAKELLAAIREVVYRDAYDEDEDRYGEPVAREEAWDSRWLSLFIRLDQPGLVCMFAQRPDKEVTAYLTGKLREARWGVKDAGDMLATLFRIRYKEAPERFMELLERGAARNMYYMNGQQRRLVASMPKSYAPRLRAFGEKLTYESLRAEWMTQIDEIEQAPESAEEENGRGLWGWLKSKMS
ncbi:HEAT repeat domain-containing protein [Cohnella hashimotonis]|uniref:HEAT repeat domain-containing protein n=1 Tax=Cohnella hashimotonis TaxID=2826895 RepID=A0ABT6TFF0_9BACL|nr:HEAT repeat domain-containing protein [Cohnella hashimotonis]MDI4645568.1 HEAT repeat domain-containing protein [Cohnella hashimotonis]